MVAGIMAGRYFVCYRSSFFWGAFVNFKLTMNRVHILFLAECVVDARVNVCVTGVTVETITSRAPLISRRLLATLFARIVACN